MSPKETRFATIAFACLLTLLGTLFSGLPSDAAAGEFVTVREGRFELDGRPYRFVGANFWQGMNLGASGNLGDRARLLKELDELQRLGVTNLRVLASSEGPDSEPYRVVPALMTAPGVYNGGVMEGLDFLLAEMGKRGMRAVMVLTNYWHWSGGMAQYVAWHEKSSIPYPGDWGRFMNYSARFYGCEECQGWYRAHIATLVSRSNRYNGVKYRDDPTIFAWELANEPRRYPYAWVNDTARYIKSIDPNHLVTTGSEGTPPGELKDFTETHRSPDIDYTTIHIWPGNWGWFDPANPGSYSRAEANVRAYLQEHDRKSAALAKPLVVEEFGLARDWEPHHDIYHPASPTGYRDRLYGEIFRAVEESVAAGGASSGDNFWAWAGSARPGEKWIGDPPHEPAGWYSVYDSDTSTKGIIAAHAAALKKAGRAAK